VIDPTELLKHEQEIEAEVARQTRFLRDENARLSDEAEELRRMATFYDSLRNAPIKVPAWRKPKRSGKTHVHTQMVSLTDWHLDEKVDPAEVLEINAYNRKIAHQRIELWTNKIVSLPQEYMTGLDIEGLIVPTTGDLFTGEIHDELTVTNEDPILASMLYWMEPIIGMIEGLAGEFRGIELDCVPGNHPRTTKRFDHKQRVKKSYEQFFWAVVRDRLKDRGKAGNVTINVSPGSSMNIQVYGRNYVLDHGYEFKGGTGISGAFAPLSLGSHRKNMKQTVAGTPMHTMIIGHMHQIINIPGVIMGGTLKGYDEYASDLNLRPDENGAGQAMWITSPERAQVMWMPIYVQDRAAEGW
jgi:hypothetical protein